MTRIAILCGVIAATAWAGDERAEPYVWANAQIVGGGFVSGIITNPKFPVIYCRTDIGGAYRWNREFGRWTSISDWIDAENWNYMGTESLALDPHNGSRVFIAAGMYTNSWAGNGAILRSEDQGATWKIFPLAFKLGGNEPGRNNDERLAVDPNDGDVLYLGTRHDGIWKSSDAAAHWQRVKSFPQFEDPDGQGIVYVTFDERSGEGNSPTPVIYAAVSNKTTPLYRSTDAGQTWQAVAGAPTGYLPHRAAWDQERSLYMTFGDKPGPSEVTSGAVWKLNTVSGQWSDVTPLRPSSSDKFGYQAVTIDSQHPRTVMVGTLDRWMPGDDIFRSTDGGGTWKALGNRAQRDFSAAPWMTFAKNPAPLGPFGHWIASLEIDPFDSDHAIYCTGWGIWSTNDLTNSDSGWVTHWRVGAKGVEELVANKVISPPFGAPVLSVVWDLDGFRHDTLYGPPAKGFFVPEVGRNTSIDFAQLKANVMARVYGGQILGHDFGKMTGGAVSEDNGVTWKPFGSRPNNAVDGEIAVSADGSTLVWSPQNGPMCYSNDMGERWTLSQGAPASCGVISDRVNPALFYSFDHDTRTIYVSTDGGKNFAGAARDLPQLGGDLHAVPGEEGDLWLATEQGLYHSRDAAASFVRDDAVHSAYKVGFGKAAPGQNYPSVYINGRLQEGQRASEYGFYRSDDQGRTWVRINDNQHQFGQINSMTGDPRVFGRVYLASNNRGIVFGQPEPANNR